VLSDGKALVILLDCSLANDAATNRKTCVLCTLL